MSAASQANYDANSNGTPRTSTFFSLLAESKLISTSYCIYVYTVMQGPWKSYIEGRDHTSDSNFIMTGGEDIELLGATEADQVFIAHARQDIPQLLAEI